MRLSRLFAAGLAVATISAPAAAQRQGQIEIGGFGRYTAFDDRVGFENEFGFGGRLGVFLFRTFAIEAEVEQTNVTRDVGDVAVPAGDYKFTPIYVRGTFNIPMGSRSAFLLGAGYVRSDYDFEVRDGASGLVGLRIGLTPNIALRFDGLADYHPSSEDLNYGARAGLSLMLGGRSDAPPPPPPAPVPIMPAPAPAPAPAPPPPPVVNQDSINAANRARAVMQERIYFDFDRFEIRPDAAAVLEQKLAIFQANPNMRIRIQGHTDPRGSDEYNLALGERRAEAARRWLIQRGIAAARIETTTFGEEQLVCTESTEACYQLNRRDEFVITAGGDMLMGPR